MADCEDGRLASLQIVVEVDPTGDRLPSTRGRRRFEDDFLGDLRFGG